MKTFPVFQQATTQFCIRVFLVSVCPSVLTMSFPALCADSARSPGMLTCHAVLLSLLKKSGKVFVTLFRRFPPPWPAPLWHQVLWQNHGTAFLTKIEPESPRRSAAVLSLNTPAVPHQVQAIILKNCSSRRLLSLFNMVIQTDGHGQQ